MLAQHAHLLQQFSINQPQMFKHCARKAFTTSLAVDMLYQIVASAPILCMTGSERVCVCVLCLLFNVQEWNTNGGSLVGYNQGKR